ncbi:DUF3618 domain-containing protein [Tolypothrix campylonemoides VB511288]|nr:DUF3618 domain-containing protein [Tolypothrix campylonemoides VB511288]
MSATQGDIGMQSQKDPAQLEREIEQQRRHIEGIVQALENKLSPGEMFERVLNFSKGSGREFAGNLGSTVKANPMPALLTAAGLLWLYSSTRQSSAGMQSDALPSSGVQAYPTTEVAASKGSRGISERLHSVKSAVGEKAHGAAGSIRSGASSAAGSMRGGVQRASDGYGAMLRENPLAAGAIAVAVGAVLGALIPSTRKEDEMLGEASDRMVDQLKSKAREQKDTLVGKAREMTQPGGGASQGQGGSGSGMSSSGVQPSSSSSFDAMSSEDASASFGQPGTGPGLADDGASSGARPH